MHPKTFAASAYTSATSASVTNPTMASASPEVESMEVATMASASPEVEPKEVALDVEPMVIANPTMASASPVVEPMEVADDAVDSPVESLSATGADVDDSRLLMDAFFQWLAGQSMDMLALAPAEIEAWLAWFIFGPHVQ